MSKDGGYNKTNRTIKKYKIVTIINPAKFGQPAAEADLTPNEAVKAFSKLKKKGLYIREATNARITLTTHLS